MQADVPQLPCRWLAEIFVRLQSVAKGPRRGSILAEPSAVFDPHIPRRSPDCRSPPNLEPPLTKGLRRIRCRRPTVAIRDRTQSEGSPLPIDTSPDYIVKRNLESNYSTDSPNCGRLSAPQNRPKNWYPTRNAAEGGPKITRAIFQFRERHAHDIPSQKYIDREQRHCCAADPKMRHQVASENNRPGGSRQIKGRNPLVGIRRDGYNGTGVPERVRNDPQEQPPEGANIHDDAAVGPEPEDVVPGCKQKNHRGERE